MGRYAFFTTGLEHKFLFGVQPSEDIRTFGGVGSYDSYDKGYYTHCWNESDKETIEKELQGLLEWMGEAPLDWSKYEKNVEGSWALKRELYELYKSDHKEEIVARYILGCLIYHQLLYTEEVSADYED